MKSAGTIWQGMRTSLESSTDNRTVKDIYGREIGRLVGVLLDFDGSIKSVGVSESGGRLVQYSGSRIVRCEDGYLVVPEWKVDAQALAKERARLSRREAALESIIEEERSSPAVLNQVKKELSEVRANNRRLKERVDRRLSEIKQNEMEIERFAALTKIQRATGEIDEDSYLMAANYCKLAISADSKESDELTHAMGFLEDIEVTPAPVPAPEALRVEASERRRASTSSPKSQPQPAPQVQPFPEFRISPSTFRMPEPTPN